MSALYYAGVGSRTTPVEILDIMKHVASFLEEKNFILRSGRAIGADQAFESGVKDDTHKQIFLPKEEPSDAAKVMASTIHPLWEKCSDYAKACHGRNVYQILGKELNEPVKFVVCWTPDGKEVGGTRTAIVLAKKHNIPVYNLAINLAETTKQLYEDIVSNKFS